MVKLSSLIFTLVFISTIAACGSEQSRNPVQTPTSGDDGAASAPYPITSSVTESNLGSSQGTPKELEAIWEAWALLNNEHIERASFDS